MPASGRLGHTGIRTKVTSSLHDHEGYGDSGRVAAVLADRLGLEHETCHEQPGPTLRRVCVVPDTRGDRLVVDVHYDTST